MNQDQFSTVDKMNPAHINSVCQNMVNLRLAGNITPITWYKFILTNSGKPDIVAITILSDIIYWYTPTITRDEVTGNVVGLDQRFKADKLQKTYQEYSDIFGFSKNQVKLAIDNLCDRKLITREFRNIKSKTGLSINNVMYLEPVLENIIEISNKIRSPKKYGGYPPKKSGEIPHYFTPVTSEFIPVTPIENGGTNTRTTHTENTTTTTTTPDAVVSFNENVFENILEDIPEIYRNHRDVISTLKAFLDSHGMEYVKTELKYATQNSTIVTGFPAFLKRALKSGWGTDTSRVNQTLDEKKRLVKEKIIQQQKEIEKQIKERQAEAAERQKEIDKKVQLKLAMMPPDELEKLKNLARQEAFRQVLPPKELNANLMALAKKTLAGLPEMERDRIRREAEISVRKVLGDTIPDDNIGFIRSLENRMMKIIRDNYSLTSPLSAELERRIAEKAEAIIPQIVQKEFILTRKIAIDAQ